MSYTYQSISELYFEYLKLKPKNRMFIIDVIGFLKYLFSKKRIQKNINSKKLSNLIRSFDDNDYSKIYKNFNSNVSAISSEWISRPSENQIKEINNLFQVNRRDEGSKSQNIVYFEKWKNNEVLMSYFYTCIEEIRNQTNEINNFQLQNAYFVNDEFGYETYAHKFHHDDVGLRLKAWFIIDAVGKIGLEYIDMSYSDLQKRRYGIAYDIYAIKDKNLINQETKKIYAKPGVSYLLNTDIFHRGFMEPNSQRRAFVVEFINFSKMQNIDGLSDACHFNKEVSQIKFS